MILREELDKLRADMTQEWLARHAPDVGDGKQWGSDRTRAVEYQSWLEKDREQSAYFSNEVQ